MCLSKCGRFLDPEHKRSIGTLGSSGPSRRIAVWEFQAFEWAVFDTPNNNHHERSQCGLAVVQICSTVYRICLSCMQHGRFPQPHTFLWDSSVFRFAATYLRTVNWTDPLAVQKNKALYSYLEWRLQPPRSVCSLEAMKHNTAGIPSNVNFVRVVWNAGLCVGRASLGLIVENTREERCCLRPA